MARFHELTAGTHRYTAWTSTRPRKGRLSTSFEALALLHGVGHDAPDLRPGLLRLWRPEPLRPERLLQRGQEGVSDEVVVRRLRLVVIVPAPEGLQHGHDVLQGVQALHGVVDSLGDAADVRLVQRLLLHRLAVVALHEGKQVQGRGRLLEQVLEEQSAHCCQVGVGGLGHRGLPRALHQLLVERPPHSKLASAQAASLARREPGCKGLQPGNREDPDLGCERDGQNHKDCGATATGLVRHGGRSRRCSRWLLRSRAQLLV
mmetsp:Transcript_41802/g.116571  ORF Transcript_41802/g.116571 Transcript_41802/m.116571 type:complete len:261 (+) Transcript_41802:183-965(+)